MELSRYVQDLQERLTTAAASTGEDAARVAAYLTAPLDAAVRLVLLDALSTAAAEISAELAPGSVDLRLRAGEPEFVVSAAAAPAVTSAGGEQPAAADVTAEVQIADGTTTRTTLRLPDALKAQVEVAAAREGLSVNTWLVRAVATALDQPAAHPAASPATAGQSGRGTRVTGWVR